MDIKDLQELITSITKWGLRIEVVENKIDDLKRTLVTLYSYCLDVNYVFDEKEYADCPDFNFEQIRKNIESNFPDFGFYNLVSNLNITYKPENIVGDAVDDLSDIIKDLLEVKWRVENNSISDGLWFLSFSFENHFEQHLIDLLNYIKTKQ